MDGDSPRHPASSRSSFRRLSPIKTHVAGVYFPEDSVECLGRTGHVLGVLVHFGPLGPLLNPYRLLRRCASLQSMA